VEKEPLYGEKESAIILKRVIKTLAAKREIAMFVAKKGGKGIDATVLMGPKNLESAILSAFDNIEGLLESVFTRLAMENVTELEKAFNFAIEQCETKLQEENKARNEKKAKNLH